MTNWNRRWLAACLVLVALAVPIMTASPRRPHIVFIVADDLGWNDIGYHNPDIISPNLDQLSQFGIVLNNLYVQPLCSPSRTALMTGYYPFRVGMQHLMITRKQAVCAAPKKTLLPEILQKNGYSTHMVGKWHLGFCNWSCTPTYRGFDSFLGYYSGTGERDYFSKTATLKSGVSGIDFHRNEQVAMAKDRNYSTDVYGDEVVRLVQEHDESKQFFLYFPFQSVHKPLQVPDYYYNLYPNVSSEGRRIFSGMVTAMDDAVGRLTRALKEKGMYDDTIIIFISDNGGNIPAHGNNYPLRGGKRTIWEGGTRVPGFIHYAKLKTTGVQYEGLMHAVDWFPTIAEAAGISYTDPEADGVSHWKSITTLSESPRNEFVYNLDFDPRPLQGRAAIRVGDYKLIDGFPGTYIDWYQPGTEWKGYTIPKDVNGTDWWQFKGLYNLKDDPHERKNLYNSHPEIVKSLWTRLELYFPYLVPADYPQPDPAGDPSNFGGVWSPGWC